VRLDDVALTGPDPFAANDTQWDSAQYASYLEYARRVAASYSSAFYQGLVD